ncbi:hypothetical protein SLEP1_g29653 [Rubroshorea leprosula]|uniref:Uncharacterized protein n=1 Tax=Rubroshorea leprosula TaxID=152421 RepID=A0AAV5JXN8_9ROSI|nr:hypothetical protein SLEP1_g29653 [Rubroshorea leprosula]
MRRFALPALLLFLTLALLQDLCFAQVNGTFLRETFNETFEGRSVVFEKEDYRGHSKDSEKLFKELWATLEENLESEMIRTVGPEGFTAANSSSLRGMVNSPKSWGYNFAAVIFEG